MVLTKIVAVSRDQNVQHLARQVGKNVFLTDDLAEVLHIVETIEPELIVLDDKFGSNRIQEFLATTDKTSNDIPVVVVGSDESRNRVSTDFIAMGAYDFLPNRTDHIRLQQIATRIVNESDINATKKNATDFFVDDCAASVGIVGRSRALVKTLGMIRLVAASKCNPVLIVGETGTGKELAAKAIHALRHPDEPFVAVNCAALTASLLESELFGHRKGAFTGADRDKTGLLELAASGTILLDEISETPLDLQAKLLRVLQERTFRKVGGVKNITCKATIMASSNRNLYRETKAGRFRRDLYYRLNICPVYIAPLKSPDRKEDIPLLAEYFLKTSTICPEKHTKITSLTKFAVEALQKHDWPGNVRELQNVIERAILLETTDKIGLNNIKLHEVEYENQEENLSATNVKDFSLAKAERELIARALQQTDWQKTQAAALLGITRTTLYAKVKQYNISKDPHNSKSISSEATEPYSHQPALTT